MPNNNKLMRDLSIDKYNLDKELTEQPQKYMEWALQAATASDEKDNAKKNLELVRAAIEEKIRKTPKKYDIDKITEGIVRAVINLHPRVKKYNDIYLKAAHQERVLIKIEKAFSHRKSSLEGLTRLDSRLHFSEPRVPQKYEDRQNTKTGKLLRGNLKRRK